MIAWSFVCLESVPVGPAVTSRWAVVVCLWYHQTDRGEPYSPGWGEDSGCLWSACDPWRNRCKHQLARSAKRPESSWRLLPGNQSCPVWRNHYYQSVITNNMSIQIHQSPGVVTMMFVLQWTMSWWSPGLVYCQCLISGRRWLNRGHAATSLSTWTSHAGMKDCMKNWRPLSKIEVRSDLLIPLGKLNKLDHTKHIRGTRGIRMTTSAYS